LHSFPVNDAERPFASTQPTWRFAPSSSAPVSAFSTSSGASPFASASSPLGPYVVFAQDCVAIAPTPAFAHGTTLPTPKNFDCTATPRSPVAGSKPTTEKVATTGAVADGW